MKGKLGMICLFGSVLMGLGILPLLAQQAGPGPSLQGMAQGQWGQGPSPYQGSLPQIQSAPAQGQIPSSQGAQRAPGIQGQQQLDPAQINPRPCGWVAVARPPSLAFPQALPSPPQTVPVQGLLAGSPGASGSPGAGPFQPAGVQLGSGQQNFSSSGPLFAQGSLSNPVPVLYREPISSIEATFQHLPVSGTQGAAELRQYGYSLFSSPVSTFAPVEDVPVGPDYILGPGDDIAINVWGAMESGVLRTVDRNGQIILPSAGPVRVWGLSFSQAERLIREQLARSYRGFQTSVTMGRLRTIRVYVVGEVCQPGSFTLSSLSTVTNALFSAGGPLKLGSLREIQIKRNHHTVGTLDLYDFLLRGDKTRDFRLESGDTIFIPPIGPIAAIAGEVKRPAIYELHGLTRIGDLIEMAGGLTPQSYLKRVQVIRAKPNASREVIDLDLTTLQGSGNSPVNIEIRNGDLVKIYPTDPRVYNTVSLAGVVKYPGEYEMKPNMRLSQLLPQGSILPEAYADGVEVMRFKEDMSTEVIQVSLKKAWSGDHSQDINLLSRDQVTVRSEFRSPWSVTLGGEVKRPGTYTMKQGERLSSVIKRAGGFTDKAYLKVAVFTRETVKKIEEEQLKNFLKTQEERLLAQAGIVNVVGIEKEESGQNERTLAAQRELLRSIAGRVAIGRMVIKLDKLEQFEGSASDIILEDGDKLFVPSEPSSVTIVGAVRNPTSILYKEDEGVEYYLNRAGGLTKQADEKEVYIAKGDGSAITGFTKLRKVESGDAIIVPPKEEEKYRWLSISRDWITILGSTMLSIAALSVLF